MICPACSAEVAESAKFCTECGAPLRPRCAACGAQHAPDQKFCAECGAALAIALPAADAPAAGPATPPAVPELRLVSVLFVDLVGYTELSQSR